MRFINIFSIVVLAMLLTTNLLYTQQLPQNPTIISNVPPANEGDKIQNIIIQESPEKTIQKTEPTKSRATEPLSQFENFLKESGMNLVQFGYKFFTEPASFQIDQKVPVPGDYLLGPGDEIKISVWGKIEGNWAVTVDRDGNISLPKIGVIGVSNLSFLELKDVLNKELSKYYTGFQMNVSMGSLKSIRIYVLGNAYKPGSYQISSLSTLVSAIFDTGGPSKSGTMRNIKLIRNGKVIRELDLYKFLLKGDKTDDLRLMPEDVIFYPPIGNLIAINGSVKNPAIYELREEKTLKEIIEMAGGLSDVAYKGRVQIKRVVDGQRQIVFEDSIDNSLNKQINPADIVEIFAIHSDKRIVKINGAIHRPGDYGFSTGMRVKNLLDLAGGLTYYAYKEVAELTRVYPTNIGPKTEKIYINLQKALADDPNHNIELQQDDYLFVRAVPEWDLYKQVTIKGEVKFPGVYTIKKGEKLSSLLERAGGFTDKAYLEGTVFIRQRVKELQQRSINEMVERLERELLSTGTAEVATALSPEEAKVKEAEIRQKRDFVNRLRNVTALGRISIKMDVPERLKNTHYDIELEDNDIIEIPSNPKTIFVVGSVYNQTAFVYNENESVDYYLKLAGGTTENANESAIYILKANGTAERVKSGFFGFGNVSKLLPGDTIVVPEKLERIAWMKNIKDITQILYQIAVTAGVLIVAF